MTRHPSSASSPAPGLTGRDIAVLLAAAAGLQVFAWAVLLALFSGGVMGYGLHDLSDTLIYHLYSARFSMGQWPYADVPVEYPPLANVIFLLAPGGETVAGYERWMSAAMLLVTTTAAVVTTAAAAAAWRSLGRPLAAAAVYAVLTLSCGALALNRYDAVVALFIAIALAFFLVRAWLPAGVSLGIGFALKLTPALLLPLAVLLPTSWRRRCPALAGFLIAAAIPFLPFAINDLDSVGYPFTYHSGRPLQVESVLGTPWLAHTLLTGTQPKVESSYGSQNIASITADRVAQASPWLVLLALAGATYIVWRRREVFRAAPRLVPLAALLLVLAAICMSKVLSPQFLIWTFPIVALVAVQKSRLAQAAAAACTLATLLTQLEFPARYWRFIAFEPGPVAIVVARNSALLAATALCVLAALRLRLDGSAALETATETPTSRS